MNYGTIEDKYLIYYKLMDGLTISPTKGLTACDLSFNDYITSLYLSERKEFSKIYNITKDEMKNINNITPIPFQSNIAYTMNRIKTDYIISLGGVFHLQPLFDAVHSIHKSLNFGGKFLLAVYPDVYDENGRDIINGLSLISEIPVKEKFVRWTTTLKNSLSNIFMRVNSEEILHTSSFEEIKTILGLSNFKDFVFKDESELNRFLHPIAHIDREYTISWHIITGMKI